MCIFTVSNLLTMKRFFKITSSLSTQEVKGILDNLDKVYALNVYEMHQQCFYELIENEDGTFVIFAALGALEVSELVLLASIVKIDIDFEDITDDIIKTYGKCVSSLYTHIPKAQNAIFSTSEALEYMFTAHYIDHVDTNDVLDKISEQGIDAINESDRVILDNQ